MTRILSVIAVLITVSSAVVGCADPVAPHIETVFDPCAPLVVVAEGDAAQVASVAVGLDIWNVGAGTRLLMEDAAAVPASDLAAQQLPVRFDTAGAAFHGYYDDIAGIVFINADIASDHDRAVTVAHEIGHAFGLFHVSTETRPSLMNDGNTTVGLSDADVDALVALWGACPRANDI